MFISEFAADHEHLVPHTQHQASASSDLTIQPNSKASTMSITSFPSAPSSPQLTYASASPQRHTTTKKRVAKQHQQQLSRAILQTQTPSRKSRIVYNFTLEQMAPYYHLPQREAAKLLGVAVITIKRTCKRRGIRWPYRDAKLKKIQEARVNAGLSWHHEQHWGAPQSVSGMTLLSEAAFAFARLPFECMQENAYGGGMCV